MSKGAATIAAATIAMSVNETLLAFNILSSTHVMAVWRAGSAMARLATFQAVGRFQWGELDLMRLHNHLF
jgi:hypothetical protein